MLKGFPMKLVSDWRHVLRNAWSVRLIVLAALLSGLEVVLPSSVNSSLVVSLRLSRFSRSRGRLSAAFSHRRILKMGRKTRLAGTAAITLVGKWEGCA